MDKPADADISAAFAAALDWWREAGVDHVFADAPQVWFSPAAPEDKPPPQRPLEEPSARNGDGRARHQATEQARPLPDRETWPGELAGFAQWWLSAPELEPGPVSGRVPPRGAKAPPLMVIVPEPEREDTGKLLSGPQGRLLDAILAAMGVAPGNYYLASVLPRHTPAADWQAITASGLGEVLHHHIALVSPERLMTFGSNIPPLIGNDLPQASAVLRKFNHEGRSIPLLAARSLPAMLEMPRWKAELWKVWLDWTIGRE